MTGGGVPDQLGEVFAAAVLCQLGLCVVPFLHVAGFCIVEVRFNERVVAAAVRSRWPCPERCASAPPVRELRDEGIHRRPTPCHP